MQKMSWTLFATWMLRGKRAQLSSCAPRILHSSYSKTTWTVPGEDLLYSKYTGLSLYLYLALFTSERIPGDNANAGVHEIWISMWMATLMKFLYSCGVCQGVNPPLEQTAEKNWCVPWIIYWTVPPVCSHCQDYLPSSIPHSCNSDRGE